MDRLAAQDITRLLESASAGDEAAFDRVYEIVYAELRRLARVVRRGRASETLNTTALVHEAYLHLLPSQRLDWRGRDHFMAIAARAMRQVLVRTAEKRAAKKRGGGLPDTFLEESRHAASSVDAMEPERILALDAALQRLETLDARQARVVEYRFFAGLSVEETARILAVSEPTVKRDWRAARAWLTREMVPA